ncbi:stress response membrane protein YncL [Franconibacter pulveris]|nr:stress response membrane protein YncL [Franconibacter pulveris]
MNVSSKTVVIINCLAAVGLLLTLSVRFQWL